MLTNPSIFLRTAYCLVLAGFILPLALLPATAWTQFVEGGWRFAGVSFVLSSMLAILAVVRIYLVVRYPTALCTPRLSQGATFVRKLGIVLIYIGLVTTVLDWVAAPLMRMHFSARSESGVEFFLVAFIMGMVKVAGTSGLIVFEFSRLLGFEKLAFEHAQRQR